MAEMERIGLKGFPRRNAEYIAPGEDYAFPTPSGKVELYSSQLQEQGFDPMPRYTPPEIAPAGFYRLIYGRMPAHSFGRTTNNRFLSEVYPENEVLVNVRAARALPGFEERPLKTGDRVRLINQDGVKSDPVRARVTERIRGDAVYLYHGFGHSAKGLKHAYGRGASDSELVTRYKTDPIMGGTGMNVNFVRVEPAPAAAGSKQVA